jgi:hypothetical protein
MSNEQLRKDTNDDRARNAANESYRPGQSQSAGAPSAGPSTNPTISTKPCGDATSCEMPLGSGVPQQTRAQQQGGQQQRDPLPRDQQRTGHGQQQFVAGDVGSRGQGSDGHGGGGAGTEQTRGAHPRGQRPDTKDDRHPGSGWQDDRSVTPPATELPQRQQPGRPKGQTTGQQPVSTAQGGNDVSDATGTTNRPGGNPQVEPRTVEKTKTYEGPTGVSGEAGSNADDV